MNFSFSRFFRSKLAASRKLAWLVGLALLFQVLFLATAESNSTVLAQATTPGPSRQLPSPTPAGTRTTTPTATPGPSPTPAPTPTRGPKVLTRPPTLKASSAIVVDAATGRILYAKDPHTSRPQASTTKIMTALTLLSMYPSESQLQTTTTVIEEDLIGEANMGLRKGERVKLSTLLLGLMTNSANEAGIALARHAGQRLPGPAGSVERFVAAMNTQALSLGMYESHFMNPHGLDQPGHYASAYDLALSGWYALRNPLLMQYAQYVSGQVDGHNIYNVNSFLTRYPGATGIKPGWTDEGGRCLVASATNNGRTLIGVVMNSTIQIAVDIDALMDYGFTLLDGRAEQSLASVNLGSLSLPRTGAASTRREVTLKGLQAALRLQFEHSLRVAISVRT